MTTLLIIAAFIAGGCFGAFVMSLLTASGRSEHHFEGGGDSGSLQGR